MCKLKDDGDFDRLRLKIIRQLKENEELCNNIIAIVKQSSALTRPGAENMKPRQLSDAIQEEVGEKLMNQISDSLWGIIRSPNGMKKEITKAVESVYNALSNPGMNESEASPSMNDMALVQKQEESTKTQESPHEVEDISDSEPPGFSLSNPNKSCQLKQPKEEPDWDMTYNTMSFEGHGKEPQQLKEVTKPDAKERDPPGFCMMGIFEHPIDIVDDDPDVPPGFG